MNTAWAPAIGLVLYLAGAIQAAARFHPEDPWYQNATRVQRAAFALPVALMCLAWLPLMTLSLLYLVRRTR
ncbi:hypothetical protein [Streptomyces cinereoruber]|uniref:hypothetical protein n=1 Tax=Streptomyces cinereoruber TaxID=67260 RepID=UPI00363D1173